MKRVVFSVVVILLAGSWPDGTAAAAGNEGVPRIGYLVLSSLTEPPSPERAGFLQGLREHGYEDGKNIVIEYRSAEGDPEALPFLAQELVDLKVKAIVCFGALVVRAARQASDRIPIVMFIGSDPVRLGLVHSLARPGTNVTGLTQIATELGPKRLQLLRSVSPGIRHVALVLDTTNPSIEPEVTAIQSAAYQLDVRVSVVGIPETTDDDALRARLTATRSDAIMTMIDPRVAAYRQFLPQFAHERRIPTMFDWEPFVEAGGLMSYVPDSADTARRAAGYVDKILKGAKPAELPMQQPTRYYLVINLKTARALGLKLPERILQRADELIQ